MTNYKEIIRLHSLGFNKTRIAESCGCARSTVITALHKAEENGLSWNAVKNLSSEEVARKLYPATSMGQQYSMPDYEWVHKEMRRARQLHRAGAYRRLRSGEHQHLKARHYQGAALAQLQMGTVHRRARARADPGAEHFHRRDRRV